MDGDEDDIWYPTVDDVLSLHSDIIEDDPNSTPGVQDEERIEFALDYVEEGHFGEVPGTIHEKAFHLMRLLASNHWFADGNKRTALNTAEILYRMNEHELDYGDDIRSILKLFSAREDLVDREAGPAYLRDGTTVVELPGEKRSSVVRELAAQAREEHRDVYDALAAERP